jgi:hypothetical protein
MGEHERTILVVEVLAQPQPRRGAPKQAGERSLAHCERFAAKIVAVKLDQVEGIEEDARVVPPIPDALERRHSIIATCHRFPVDDARACP